MKRPQKRQTFIFILVSLLLVLATLGGVSPHNNHPGQSTTLTLAAVSKSSPHPANYPAPVSPWQLNNNDVEFPKGLPAINLNVRPTRTTNHDRNFIAFYQYESVRKIGEISFRIDTPNTIFKLSDRQACQSLDIPPPVA